MSSNLDIDDVFQTMSDSWSSDFAVEFAHKNYGIKAVASILSSERDQNFLLECDDGNKYVLKVTNVAEDPNVTDFQTKAQLYLMASSLNLPIPHLLRTQDSQYVCLHQTESGDFQSVRLITFLQGVPMHKVKTSEKLRHSLGIELAKFDYALRDFSHSQENHILLWDMQHASNLKLFLPYIENNLDRDLAEHYMERFTSFVKPALDGLRRQVIHNDMNKYNLLVDSKNSENVTAILDFGDMVKAPLINDLAVASAYQLADDDNPFSTVVEIVKAYNSIYPLEKKELAILPDLIITRLLITILITGWRAQKYPENKAYILRNNPYSWSRLKKISEISESKIMTFFEKSF